LLPGWRGRLSQIGGPMAEVSAPPWGDRPLSSADVLDAEQVAELLGLRRSTIEDYGRRGVLRSVTFGRHRRFLRADVEAFVLTSRT
jgi:excisionase family DNA binding protein